MEKRMLINGFRAAVLEDKHSVIFSSSSERASFKLVVDGAQKSPTRKELEALLTRALSEGFDEVVLLRDLYVKYDLRMTMRSRSGSIVQERKFTLSNGKWVESRRSKRSLY